MTQDTAHGLYRRLGKQRSIGEIVFAAFPKSSQWRRRRDVMPTSIYLYLSRKHKHTICQSHTAHRTVRPQWYWTLQEIH